MTDDREHVTDDIAPHLREEPPPGSVPRVRDLTGDQDPVSPTDVGPGGVGGLGAERAGGMPNGFAGATRGPAGTAFPRQGVPGADGTGEGNPEVDEEEGRTA